MMRIVIDANVLISAALCDGSVPGIAVEAAKQFTLILSSESKVEYEELFNRDKFDRYTDRPIRLAFLQSFLQSCDTIAIGESIRVCRDPKDDKYLELAVSGSAHCIITGDGDLLALHPFRGIAILTPKDFLA